MNIPTTYGGANANAPAAVPPTERSNRGTGRFHLFSSVDTTATIPHTAYTAKATPTYDNSVYGHFKAASTDALPVPARNAARTAAAPAIEEARRKNACRADRPMA